jgi:glutamate carboxypeptidase
LDAAGRLAGSAGGATASEDAAVRIRAEMEALVAISSPSGDLPGAEAAVALCRDFLPAGAVLRRLPCSTAGCADDLLAVVHGTGARRLLLLGHLDTVVAHEAHVAVRAEGERLYGSGTADMKGGVAVSLAVARALADQPSAFAELALLLVCDEEWRTAAFAHGAAFADYDACLCFEAGERTPAGEEAVIVRRKGAGTLRVRAAGRSAHSGSAPHRGRNALTALAKVAVEVAALNDPAGPDRLTVVPTVIHAGQALNVVPGSGELLFDLRAEDVTAFQRVQESVPESLDEVTLSAVMERVWPAMDSTSATAELLARASELLGRPIVAHGRGGASDASHFAPFIPLTVDGLGPRGGDAHNPGEFVYADSLAERFEIACALARAALSS